MAAHSTGRKQCGANSKCRSVVRVQRWQCNTGCDDDLWHFHCYPQITFEKSFQLYVHALKLRTKLMEVIKYMSKMWTESPLWPRQPGVHTRYHYEQITTLKGRTTDSTNRHERIISVCLYLLIRLPLHDENECIDLHNRLLSDRKLTKRIRRPYREQLWKSWKEFEDGKMTIGQVLKACSIIYEPTKILSNFKTTPKYT